MNESILCYNVYEVRSGARKVEGKGLVADYEPNVLRILRYIVRGNPVGILKHDSTLFNS